MFVVARITHIALPCELTVKLTGATVCAYLLQIAIDLHIAPIFHNILYYTYMRGRLLMPAGQISMCSYERPAGLVIKSRFLLPRSQ